MRMIPSIRSSRKQKDRVCDADVELAPLVKEFRDATTRADQSRITKHIAAIKEKRQELAIARMSVENQVIQQLNARDRLRNIQAKNRRLFPATSNGQTTER